MLAFPRDPALITAISWSNFFSRVASRDLMAWLVWESCVGILMGVWFDAEGVLLP